MNSQVYIVAWATVYESERKLSRAGADRVLSPFELGGFEFVQSLIHPKVMDFLYRAFDIRFEKLQLVQLIIIQDSGLVGESLQDCHFSNI